MNSPRQQRNRVLSVVVGTFLPMAVAFDWLSMHHSLDRRRFVQITGAGGVASLSFLSVAADPAAAQLSETYIKTCLRSSSLAWRDISDADIRLLRRPRDPLSLDTLVEARTDVGDGGVILMRFYGGGASLLERPREAAVAKALSGAGFGPKILGEFGGTAPGRVEEFIGGVWSAAPAVLWAPPFVAAAVANGGAGGGSSGGGGSSSNSSGDDGSGCAIAPASAAVAVELARLHAQRPPAAGPPARPSLWPTLDRWLHLAKRRRGGGSGASSQLAAAAAQEASWLRGVVAAPENEARRQAVARLRELSNSPRAAVGPYERVDLALSGLAVEFADAVRFCHNRLRAADIHIESAYLATAAPAAGMAVAAAAAVTFARNEAGPSEAPAVVSAPPPLVPPPLPVIRITGLEYAAHNYRGYDLAAHLCERSVAPGGSFNGVGGSGRSGCFPSDAEAIALLSGYVAAASPRLWGNLRSGEHEGLFLRELLARVREYGLASHLTWTVWSAARAAGGGGGDSAGSGGGAGGETAERELLEIGEQRFEKYRQLKAAVLHAAAAGGRGTIGAAAAARGLA
ncbi:unnamed protein product [Phaeothamnion confervicola]